MPFGRRAEYKGEWRNVIPLMGADDITGYAKRMIDKEATKNREVTELMVSAQQHIRLGYATRLFDIPVSVVEPDEF